MKKLLVVVLFVMFMMPLAVSQAWAADDMTQAGVTDVGNKICPVMGEPVNGEDFVVYEGKRYGLCCPGCKSAFLADPAAAIAKMNAQEVVPVSSASEEMQKDMEQGDL